MSINMSRQIRSLANTCLAMISQIMIIIVGFFLSQVLIKNYGSETNGLISSLQQIIAYFTLAEAGLLGTTTFALYKPLAENNLYEVKRILAAAKKFYHSAGIIYFILLTVAVLIYPFVIAKTSFSTVEIMAFVMLIGVNGATQLWFIGKYKALLIASQYSGIVLAINSISNVIYSSILIIMAELHVYIGLALSIAVCAYLVRAFAFWCIIKKIHPQVNYKTKYDGYKFKQKNDVFFQQILSMVVMNSPIVVLTFMKSSMETISVYTVYNFVLSSIFLLMYSIENSMTASFGDVIARGDMDKLKRSYEEFETIYQIFWSWFFSCLAFLYLPFIKVYTSKFTDAQYILPTECIIFTFIGAFWTIRNQQSIIVTAAGRYREMRNGNIYEAILAVVLSIFGYKYFGLIGLLAGRLISAIYRTIDFIFHNNRHVLKVPVTFTVRQIFLSVVCIVISYSISSLVFSSYQAKTFVNWIYEAVISGIISALIIIVFRLIIDNRMTNIVFKRLKKMFGNNNTSTITY